VIDGMPKDVDVERLRHEHTNIARRFVN
jgi:hypothetical protein